MTERIARRDSPTVSDVRATDEPPEWASGLFEQYGPCPECGEETVTYSMEFEDSDLACYTCGHWLDVHEAATRQTDDPGGAGSEAVTSGIGEMLKSVRSLV